MHNVEVDDEVFAFVQKHAEPLVDTFNSALRRILASGKTTIGEGRTVPAASSGTDGEAYQFPPGTPQALLQILEVVRLVHSGTDTRTGATKQVAMKLRVFPQTILDKYTRQLGLAAAEFDRLLAPERCQELRSLLHSKFPGHVDAVDQVLGASVTSHREHLVDIAERIFGPSNGVELAIPHRGTAPHRRLPDFLHPEHNR
jgi:hypothetical protein